MSTKVLTPALVFSALALAVCLGEWPQARSTGGSAAEKPADNSLCYVCHLHLQEEKIATVHLKGEITCVDCHGSSADHMHDEMLMTTPDILFGRTEVNDMCRQCHKPHKDAAKVRAFLEKWRGRDRPNGRVITENSICTDCHGRHNIVRDSSARRKEEPEDWTAAFNGEDLAGWRPSGASWTVKRGRIVGVLVADGKGGDLWSQSARGDYQLAVTFRAEWPLHAGVWLSATDAEPGPRVEIFESREPRAFTGSVRVGGKDLALLNLRKDLLDREGWNTLAVKVQGNRIQVWLNGEEIGAVRTPGLGKGRIGLHLEGGPEYSKGELSVREVLVQPLAREKEK